MVGIIIQNIKLISNSLRFDKSIETMETDVECVNFMPNQKCDSTKLHVLMSQSCNSEDDETLSSLLRL